MSCTVQSVKVTKSVFVRSNTLLFQSTIHPPANHVFDNKSSSVQQHDACLQLTYRQQRRQVRWQVLVRLRVSYWVVTAARSPSPVATVPRASLSSFILSFTVACTPTSARTSVAAAIVATSVPAVLRRTPKPTAARRVPPLHPPPPPLPPRHLHPLLALTTSTWNTLH
jgi:hypothetical protein